jgi:hypothetical protein
MVNLPAKFEELWRFEGSRRTCVAGNQISSPKAVAEKDAEKHQGASCHLEGRQSFPPGQPRQPRVVIDRDAVDKHGCLSGRNPTEGVVVTEESP